MAAAMAVVTALMTVDDSAAEMVVESADPGVENSVGMSVVKMAVLRAGVRERELASLKGVTREWWKAVQMDDSVAAVLDGSLGQQWDDLTVASKASGKDDTLAARRAGMMVA